MADEKTEEQPVGGLKELMDAMSESLKYDKILGEKDYPVEVSKINLFEKRLRDDKPCLVAIRHVDEKVTRLGLYLGDMPTHLMPPIYHTKTKEVSIMMDRNPAIFVPSLMKVVWGYESWWHVIKTEADLKQITDQDIQEFGAIFKGLLEGLSKADKEKK